MGRGRSFCRGRWLGLRLGSRSVRLIGCGVWFALGEWGWFDLVCESVAGFAPTLGFFSLIRLEETMTFSARTCQKRRKPPTAHHRTKRPTDLSQRHSANSLPTSLSSSYSAATTMGFLSRRPPPRRCFQNGKERRRREREGNEKRG